MVKLQKPIPKKLGNKPKLDNPIKQKKQQLKKEKSATTVVKNTKAKLLDDSTPVKEAKVSLKPAKEVIQKKQNKKELNGDKKSAKRPLILAPPESPKPKEKKSKKKNDEDKSKNVVKNGTEKDAKHTKVPEKVAKKVISLPEPLVPIKPTKPSKKVKGAAVKDEPASSKLAAPVVKAVPAKAEDLAPPKVSKKKKKQSIAPEIEPVAPVLAKQPKAIPQKKTESLAPQPKEKEEPAAPVPAKPGKKQKQKNKKSAVAVAEPTPAIEKIKNVKKPKNRMQEKKIAKVAFRKAQLAAKDQPKKEKKPNVGPSFRYDPIPYDEEKFNSIVNKENIKKIAEALKTTVQKEVSTKKSTIFDDYRYFLQIGSFKIPNCPKRMVKLNLKHSLVGKDDDVLLVVADLQRGAKVDYEPTKHHYEDMLRHYGIEGITVMPMNQLRKEHGTYEQKRRLCASYEYYMCDGRIVSHVGAIVGKLTQKPRNTFHAVRLNEDKDIKTEIEKSLKRTAYRQVAKSNLHTIPVGTHKFTTEQLVENIEFVVDQLKKIFPGGMGNVRNLHLRIGLTGTSSLPLYISMAQAPEKTPMVIGPREERMIKLKKEANEVLTKFAMTKEGKLIKLTKAGVEKKRKVKELKTALKEEEETARKAKKAKKASEKEAKNGKEVKELELPENEEEEEDDDDNSSDEDDEDAAQVGSGSEDETEDDEMANLDEDAESGAEIVENGFVGEDDEESEDDDEADASENDEDDEEDDDDDDDEDEAEESD